MFQAYHGVTGAQHQTNFNSLSVQGYRMISLSVYGDPADPRYAAVWVQRCGPAWVAVHGVDSAEYQSFFNNWTAKGLGQSPLDLASPLYIPDVYGGDGEIKEVGDPNAGTGASAHALTQFIHRHAV